MIANAALTFRLSPELEAHEPPEARGLARDEVRMLVSATEHDRIEHAVFQSLPQRMHVGDVLVVNTSATLPAALRARDARGLELGLHVSTVLPGGVTVVEPRNAPGLKPGDALRLEDGGRARLLWPYRNSQRLWLAIVETTRGLNVLLERYGKPIRYPYLHGEWPLEAYQTVFALHPGSAEMPSAGRPFSARVLQALARRGVVIARLILHCGVASLEHDEPPYEEYFSVPAETAAAINAARAAGRRVLAVGTTVARALESSLDGRGRVVAARGWTDLV
ncbi:MAG: S-adenosylmethionine:tRNA ribosyltransferase-isomerase, partial [Candidatus Eremiobacteraeota bacterium]|nr:S-adenosylmethionine:tRNA ribosyltransferase-isomerase [Candidatus Eremiobacteraeota bacterium]